MLSDRTRFVFTPALLSHPFLKRTARWTERNRSRATVAQVRSYLANQLTNIQKYEASGADFEYRSFYHALKWEMDRLDAESGL